MADTTTDTTLQDSGNTPADNGTGTSFDINNLVSNAGPIFTGLAQDVAAINGKAIQSEATGNVAPIAAQTTLAKNPAIWIIAAVMVILIIMAIVLHVIKK